MKKITKIDPLSFGKTMGAMYVIMGLVFGSLITIFIVLGSLLFSPEENHLEIFIGFGAIIIIPAFYGLLGFVFGVFFGWLYNLAGKWTGGIKVEIEEVLVESENK